MIYTVIQQGSSTCKARIGALCELGGVSRAGYYRFLGRNPKPEPDMALRDRIQRICLDHTSYGYRRVTAALRREGFQVNHKRVLRMMREDNLLCLRKKSFVATTNSNHGLPVYPNLAGQMAPTGINQLWASDITYIRLGHAFVYLAVVLDTYSRKVVGWALSNHIDTELTLQALRVALRKRTVRPGLVHHSDRGVTAIEDRLCGQGLRRAAAGARHSHQHESEGQSVRQCTVRTLHANPQVRRGVDQRIRRSGRCTSEHPTIHRTSVQQKAASLRPGLSPTGRVRSPSTTPKRVHLNRN